MNPYDVQTASLNQYETTMSIPLCTQHYITRKCERQRRDGCTKVIFCLPLSGSLLFYFGGLLLISDTLFAQSVSWSVKAYIGMLAIHGLGLIGKEQKRRRTILVFAHNMLRTCPRTSQLNLLSSPTSSQSSKTLSDCTMVDFKQFPEHHWLFQFETPTLLVSDKFLSAPKFCALLM